MIDCYKKNWHDQARLVGKDPQRYAVKVSDTRMTTNAVMPEQK